MYVYIFEDGTTQKHSKPPTRIDRDMIADGTLMVLQGENIQYVSEDGKLDDLEDCDYENNGEGRFHAQR